MGKVTEQTASNDMKRQDLAKKGIRLVDIGGERKKKLMGVQEFAEKLSGYTLADYFRAQPYYDLLEFSRAYPGQFEQFASILMDSAKSQMSARDNSSYERHVAAEIDFYREVYLPLFSEATSILDFINLVEKDRVTADKVSVMPLMCGSGKTSAITKKIIDVIKQDNGRGMLLVTDSVKRLEEIWNPKNTNPLLSDEEREFIKAHDKDVTILTADTYADAIAKQQFSPVLCMTTQRFFYVLTKREIREFLKWNEDGEERARPLIIFDEEPFLNEVYDLTPKTVNDIDTMLRMVLDDNPTKQTDKEWCIRQWEMFRQHFLKRLWDYEQSFDGSIFYHEETEHCLTEDDERFFNILMENRARIRADSTEVFKSLFAMKAFADTWAVYSHRSGKDYESKFTVFIDNSDKVRGLGAKVIVLDGTGDISPTYDGLDYIDMRKGTAFVRSLSCLTVCLGDINTSKEQLGNNRSIVPKEIVAYLNSLGYGRDNAVVFTYKQHEAKFRKAFKDRTEHFGNIKGFNKYEKEKCIAQVGLNQMQPVHYLVHMLARHEELRSTLVGLSLKDNDSRIRAILKETDNCAEVMISHVLADIDQNMFRSAIRNAKNRQDVSYYLFYQDAQVHDLKKAIKDRYCNTLGAHLETADEETITAAYREADTSTVGKILRWYYDWDGKPIKREEICKELEMSFNSFKETVRRNDRLKELFEKAKLKAREIGYKRGWYMK